MLFRSHVYRVDGDQNFSIRMPATTEVLVTINAIDMIISRKKSTSMNQPDVGFRIVFSMIFYMILM